MNKMTAEAKMQLLFNLITSQTLMDVPIVRILTNRLF